MGVSEESVVNYRGCKSRVISPENLGFYQAIGLYHLENMADLEVTYHWS